MQLLGAGFDYSYLLSTGTCGGILVAWKAACWAVSNTVRSRYSASIKINHVSEGGCWWLASVYDPMDDAKKPTFLDELRQFHYVHPKPWLLADDFNMIYQVVDKNNSHLNCRLMGQFRRFLNESVLKEIHLTGRLFTWSNGLSHPTLERIDRAFMLLEWEDLFPTCDL
jgi:hypothetical protein